MLWALCLMVSCGTLRRVPPVPPTVSSAGIPQQVVELTSMTQQPATAAPVAEDVQQPAVTPAVPVVEETWAGRVCRGLDSLCAQPLFETTQLGMYIYDLTEGRPLYARNAIQRLRPASCQKLVTSIAALHYLGGDYQFRTRLFTTGTVSGGVLSGDVYVLGGMDPLLSRSGLQQMVAALAREGISSIDGHLYIDLSMKDDLGLGSGWSWDDDYGPYSALMVDAKDQFAEQWVAALSKGGIRLKYRAVQQKTVPTVRHTLAARAVQRFQKMPSRKTAAMGGAMKPNTDWNTLNRFRPLMASMATVITIASTAPISTTMRPTRLISHWGAPGLKFLT